MGGHHTDTNAIGLTIMVSHYATKTAHMHVCSPGGHDLTRIYQSCPNVTDGVTDSVGHSSLEFPDMSQQLLQLLLPCYYSHY